MIIANGKVKNPGPDDPALTSPQRGGACCQITNGMMEKWNIGIVKWMMV
jgi:hypothetical protein